MASLTEVLDAIKLLEERLDKGYWIQHTYLFLATYLSWEAFKWAKGFAVESTFDGTGTGVVIAAVLAPVAAIQTFAFQAYLKSP